MNQTLPFTALDVLHFPRAGDAIHPELRNRGLVYETNLQVEVTTCLSHIVGPSYVDDQLAVVNVLACAMYIYMLTIKLITKTLRIIKCARNRKNEGGSFYAATNSTC